MGDPNFSLEIDPHADVGALSQRKTTPKHPNGSTKPFSSPTSSQTRKSSSVSKRTSSTGGRHQKAPPSSSRKGRNSQIVGASAASPCLADALKDISENVVTSGRKRSRGGTDGDRKTSSDSGVKRQKIMDSDCPSRNKAEEKNKEVVSRKLDFSDHEIVEKLPDKSGASTHSSSSPQAKPDGDPSSPCGGSLSNGHVSGLPSVHVEKRNSPVTDLMDLATDDEKTMEVAGLPSCHLKSGDEEKPSTDDIETETVDGSSSDSDDDSLPKFGCDVNENLKGNLTEYVILLYIPAHDCVHVQCMFMLHAQLHLILLCLSCKYRYLSVTIKTASLSRLSVVTFLSLSILVCV